MSATTFLWCRNYAGDTCKNEEFPAATFGKAFCNFRYLVVAKNTLVHAIYSLVETAKANNLKIYDYLKYLLTEIPKHDDETSLDFLDDLMPLSESLPEVCRKKRVD